MKTSYYALNADHKDAVAISAKVPDFYKGKCYKKLAPSWSIFNEWKKSGNTERYIERFYKEILGPLDPKKVFDDLGDNAILLCYEKPGIFCHRHIVADWLNMLLGLEITELTEASSINTGFGIN